MQHLKRFESLSNALDPETVEPGMMAIFQPFEEHRELVKVLKIQSLGSMTNEEFKDWQKLSDTGWLTHPCKVHYDMHNVPMDYIINNSVTFNTKKEFYTGNGFANLTGHDYLIHFECETNLYAETETVNNVRKKYKEVMFYQPLEKWSPSFFVPSKELINRSVKLSSTNDKTQIFDSYTWKEIKEEGDYLAPEDVKPGMRGVTFDNNTYQVLEMYNIGEMRKSQNIQQLKQLLYNDAMWTDQNIIDCVNGKFLQKWDYIAVVKEFNYNSKQWRKVLIYGPSSFLVPTAEQWKIIANDKLIDRSAKTGVLEATVVESYMSAQIQKEGVLNPEDLVEGMKGYDDLNDCYVEIIKAFKIGDLVKNKNLWSKLQKTSISRWLTYHCEEASNPSGTREWLEINTKRPYKNIFEFIKKCELIEDLSYEDYLVVVRTEHDIFKDVRQDKNEDWIKFYEVFPYRPDWIQVPSSELWKKSRKLLNTNDSTGILD